MTGYAAATGIAFINCVGNIGGFVGPYLLGAIKDATQSFTYGFLAIAALMLTGAVLVLFVDEGSECTQSGVRVDSDPGVLSSE